MRQLLAIRFKMLKHKYKQMRAHMNVLIVLLKVGKSVTLHKWSFRVKGNSI